MSVIDFKASIFGAKSLRDISAFILDLFGISEKRTEPGQSDYDNRVRGIKTRERTNEMARAILETVDDPEDLTSEQRQILAQYSGQGGLTENSQDQYYTPPEIARGVWDALKAQGFENGNVLEPSCGNGIFVGTKPPGVKVSANDLDPVASKIARLLNPEDDVKTGSLEEVATTTPDNHFDAIIGNIPFGKARGKSKHLDPAYQNENRVDRYFILRTLDKLRPGGLCCLIVPTVIVGKKDQRWATFRTEVSKKAEFLGAHKLPSGAFSKGETGTDTVIDVIVLQKHPESLLERIDSYKIEDLRAANVVWDEFVEGRWWEGEGKRFIQGTYIPAAQGERGARERVEGEIDSAAIRQKLASKFNSRIRWDLLGTAQPVVKTYSEGDRRLINGQQHEFQGGKWVGIEAGFAKEKTVDPSKYGLDSVEAIEAAMQSDAGMLSLTYGQASAVGSDFQHLLSPVARKALDFADMQPKDEVREQAYRGTIIGNRILQIMNGENVDEDFLAKTREMIVAEHEKYGHPGRNQHLTLLGQNSTAFGAFLNAMDKNGNFSELLKTGQIDKKESVFDTGDVGSIVTYLAVRVEKSPIELQDVLDLYSGDTPIKSLGDIAEIEDLAITPEGMILPLHQYCSGNIYPKISDLTLALASEKDPRLQTKWQDQIDVMLSKAVFTSPNDISFTLQQKWFKPQYIADFLKETGEYENALYDEETGEFKLSQYGATGWSKSFEDYLNGSKMIARGGDKDEVERKRREYAQRLSDLTNRFSVWMRQHEDIEEITDEYNRKFNGFVPFEYPGDPLGIEEYTSGQIENHSYQCSEIRRMSDLGSGINGFGTGLGKSFTALGLVAYNTKVNRSKRTCIVVPDAVLENWYHEARTFYSDSFFRSKVKFVGLEPKRDKEGVIETLPIKDSQGNQRIGKNGQPMFQDVVRVRKSPEDIFRDMWEIPQSNFNLVVMTKEKFRDIPVMSETRNAYVDEMVGMHLMSDSAAKKAQEGGKKKKSYQEAVSELSIEEKYSKAKESKGELPFFEEMGFDTVMYDECHFFKNSVEPGNVAKDTAFIPTAGVAAIAREIAVKSHYIRKQNCGRGVVGLSATPVTNSPFEVFNQLMQVADIEYFKGMGINGPDDFIRTFGDVQPVEKVKMTGEIKTVDGLKGFQNLDGLRGLFNRFVNVKDAEAVGQEIHVPEPVERRHLVTMNEEQEAIYAHLREEGKEAAKNFKKNPGKIFTIMRNMERVSTDPDMYFRQMTFSFPAKYAEAVEALGKDLPKTMQVKEEDDEKDGEVETVTKELEYTVSVEGDTVILKVPDSYEGHVMDRLEKFGIPRLEVCHPLTPKYAELIENARKHLERNGKQIIFTEEKTQHRKIVRILLMHLPVSEENIAIINATEANGAKLDAISKDYNGGKVKIVVCNKKAEVGVNLQRGTTAIHHLTLPWTPASINQRNGRGVRQGNHVDFVDIYYYLAQSRPREDGKRAGSLDDMRLNNLQSKARWIDELFNSKASTFLNPDADDEMIGADAFEDDPEEAARIRKQRKEEERERMIEMQRHNLRIELSNYAQRQYELSHLDETKAARKEKLEENIRKNTKKLESLEGDESQEARNAANKRKYTIQSDTAALGNLDANFEKIRAKREKQQKQARGMMEAAERAGNLPFDKALIENPDCCVHVNGTVFAKGKYVEIPSKSFRSDKRSVCRVLSVDVVRKTVVMEYVAGSRPDHDMQIDGETQHPVNWFKGAANVSYTEDDIALLKAIGEPLRYSEIAEKLTKEQFEKIKSQIRLYGSPSVYRDEEGKMYLSDYGSSVDNLVYPDLKSEAFAREVVKVWIESQKDRDRSVGEKILGVDLYGKAWAEFAPKGSAAEISAEIGRRWSEDTNVKRYATDNPEQFLEYYLDYASQDVLKSVLRLWPNTEDVKRIFDAFLNGMKADLEARAAEEKARRERFEEERRKQEEAARIEREKMEEEERRKKLAELQADPNFRELPKEIVDRLTKIGITIQLNTTSYRSRGMKGAGGPFQRVFLQDRNGKGGALFRTKDTYLKPILGATFDSNWYESSGAWWNMPVDKIDANGGFEKLASILERNV